MNTSEKNLQSLLTILTHETIIGPLEQTVSTITLDSRNAIPGTLFIAQAGETVDGHAFIPSAIEQGGTIIVCENIPTTIHPEVSYIKVTDTHCATGIIAAWYYDFPTQELEVLGVTGTNGKTTVATLLWQSLRILGKKTGLISTVSYWIDDKEFPSTHTTPDAITLQKNFRAMCDAGCTHVVMEVSSHAIAQKRIEGIAFRIGMFTNLTQDHLDFHKTMENYRDTKKQFFTSLPEHAVAITNADDKNGLLMVEDTKAKKVTYSIDQASDYTAHNIVLSTQGTTFTVNGDPVSSSLIGRFNLLNSLAVYAALLELQYEKEKIIDLFPALLPPSGRFEVFRGTEERVGIVDYAHTPDGLEKLLSTLQEMKKSGTAIIVVFGCGGNRDTTKRPIMGAAAAKYADYTVVTSDNPRNEVPETICDQVAEGFKNTTAKYEIIVDRKSAIIHAIEMSKPGDTIVVAGKGHEQYQIIGDKKIHFSDQEILRELFN